MEWSPKTDDYSSRCAQCMRASERGREGERERECERGERRGGGRKEKEIEIWSVCV